MAGRGHHKNSKAATCVLCGKFFPSTRGFSQHVKACNTKAERKRQDEEAMREIELEREGRKAKRARTRRSVDETAGMGLPGAAMFAEGSSTGISQRESGGRFPSPPLAGDSEMPLDPSSPRTQAPAPLSEEHRPNSTSRTSTPSAAGQRRAGPKPVPEGEPRKINDIKVEYHPNSGRDTKSYRFQDYARERPVVEIEDYEPWKPFSCRDDFEFAHAVLKGGMKPKQITTVLDIMQRIAQRRSEFSFKTFQDVEDAWRVACDGYPGVRSL